MRSQLVLDDADGREGKFKEIVMATAYALLPLVIIFPQTLYSIITADESSFYYLLDVIAIIWFVWLVIYGDDDGSSVFRWKNGRYDAPYISHDRDYRFPVV